MWYVTPFKTVHIQKHSSFNVGATKLLQMIQAIATRYITRSIKSTGHQENQDFT